MTLQHMKNPEVVLENAHRYLRPEGRLLIIDSYDPMRECSYKTPYLDEAMAKLQSKNKEIVKGNRHISFALQKSLMDEELSPYYEIESTNLTYDGERENSSDDLMIRSEQSGRDYLLYNLLFFQLLKKVWNIEIDFEAAYEEASYFSQNVDSWMRSGKHYLILKKASRHPPI